MVAATAPRNYPVNHVFDTDGAQRFALSVALYHDKFPLHVKGNDDITNMYNETSRLACFHAAREYRPTHIPYHRYFYSEPSEIIMVRSEGRMLSVLARTGDVDEGESWVLSSASESNPDSGGDL